MYQQMTDNIMIHQDVFVNVFVITVLVLNLMLQ